MLDLSLIVKAIIPAKIMEQPPIKSAYIGSELKNRDTKKPKIDAATNCGITIKKLKTPM